MRRIDLSSILTEKPEPIPWAVEDWLVRRGIVVLAGEPKVGKSWVAMDLALALATGGKFLGSLPVLDGPSRVLYVDAENNEFMVGRRVHQLVAGRPISLAGREAGRLRFLMGGDSNLDDSGIRQRFFTEVAEFRPQFTILDTLVRMHRRDENSNTEMARFFGDVIKPLQSQHRSGVIALHHLSKPGLYGGGDPVNRIRGAGDIVAAADQIWLLSIESKKGLVLSHPRSRWGETPSSLLVNIEDTDDGEGVQVVGVETETEAKGITRALAQTRGELGTKRQEVIERLREKGTKAPDKAATRCLGALHREGHLKKRKLGRETVYWLSDVAPADAK